MNEFPELPLRHESLAPRVSRIAPPLLVLLHGYGTNEEDLLQLAPYLPDDMHIVSMRAPYMLMPGANAWFEIDIAPGHIRGDQSQASHALTVLNESIDAAVVAYGTNPAATFVMGFSQGGAMAGLVALTRNDLKGVAILSGVNPFSMGSGAAVHAPCPVLIVHGSLDEVVPVTHGQMSHTQFNDAGYPTQYVELPIGHTIDLRVIGVLVRFLHEQMR
ncbi:MAG: alpha/beta hydrolase [Roseiflexaceae bacterium]|jgi:phospholipase/carboxylesterase